jgi:hypothetical protein
MDGDCPSVRLGVRLPANSQENDIAASSSGIPVKEEVTAHYFVTGGRMKSDFSVVYDARTGLIPGDDNGLRVPKLAGDYTLYAVVRDNRGGVSWTSVPFRAR